MTTLAQAKEAILNYFITEWGNETPITLPNENYDAPDTEWIRITVLETSGGQETLGRTANRKFLRQGHVLVSIFTEQDQGTARADALAHHARTLLEAMQILDVNFTNGVIRETGNVETWYQVVVDVTFTYNETK